MKNGRANEKKTITANIRPTKRNPQMNRLHRLKETKIEHSLNSFILGIFMLQPEKQAENQFMKSKL